MRPSPKSLIISPVRKLYSLKSKTFSTTSRYAEVTATPMVQARKTKVQFLLEQPIFQTQEQELNNKNMSKIESIIEFSCYDDKPSDVEWTLKKKDVALIAEDIKKDLIEEIRGCAEHVDDAIRCIKGF